MPSIVIVYYKRLVDVYYAYAHTEQNFLNHSNDDGMEYAKMSLLQSNDILASKMILNIVTFPFSHSLSF